MFRARVVNPRWMNAMRRHGYKGAFEMAATVDYLFGYDATAGVMADWMYERLSEEYVLDDENRKFMAESNPWALHGMAERLLEAADRGMWAQPEPDDARRSAPGAAGDRGRPRGLTARLGWSGSACHLRRRRQVRIHPADHVHQGRQAQADGDLGGARRRRPGGHHPGEVVEGQAHPQHPARDHRRVRPRR